MTIKEQFEAAKAGEEEVIAENIAITYLAYSQGMLPLSEENEKILREFFQIFKSEVYGRNKADMLQRDKNTVREPEERNDQLDDNQTLK